MPTRIALWLIVSSVAAIGAAYAAALAQGGTSAVAPWALAYGIAGSMTGMCILGAARRGTLSSGLWAAFAAMFVMVLGSFWLALGMPANEGAGGPLLLGLPRRTAIVLYGVGALPMFLLPLVYAWTFESSTLSEEDIRRVQAAAKAAGHGSAS